MEDMSVDWEPLETTEPEHMKILIEDLSSFHADFWGLTPVPWYGDKKSENSTFSTAILSYMYVELAQILL